jgi:regulator of replication initiation timing
LLSSLQEAAAARLQAKEALAQLAEREAVAAAAVEEARAARLELERVRAQLTEREVERAEAVCGQTMAKTMNEVLQQQVGWQLSRLNVPPWLLAGCAVCSPLSGRPLVVGQLGAGSGSSICGSDTC